MEIIIATNNRHKIIECTRILTGHTLLSPADVGINFEFDESGSTFLENAFGKAMALFNQTGRWVLADDSGLCVKALNNAPGVFSARYGSDSKGNNLTAEEKNQLLLHNMQGISDRSACFVCCMVLVMSEHRFHIAQETMEGVIALAPAGANGFGYDPVFLVTAENKTFAELDDRKMDSISHRGRAIRTIQRCLAAGSMD